MTNDLTVNKKHLPVYPFLTPYDEGVSDGYYKGEYNCSYEKHTGEWMEYSDGYKEGKRLAEMYYQNIN